MTVDVAAAGAGVAGTRVLDAVIEPEADGLGAWLMRLGPGEGMDGPDPDTGGGQYYVVLDGTMREREAALEKWSCVFVCPPERALSVNAGDDGLEVLVLQFPYWEKGTKQNVPAF